jgi:DNA-directed RNA polymerase specialized sigma24 family protein
MNNAGIDAKRSSAAWVRDLSSHGVVQATAIGELNTLLRRAALYTLSRPAVSGPALARARVEQIVEASSRDAVQVILERLPEFRPGRQFTTWAYKYAVRNTLKAARAARAEQEQTGKGISQPGKETVEC